MSSEIQEKEKEPVPNVVAGRVVKLLAFQDGDKAFVWLDNITTVSGISLASRMVHVYTAGNGLFLWQLFTWALEPNGNGPIVQVAWLEDQVWEPYCVSVVVPPGP